MSPPPIVKEEGVDMDPALADWLKIDDKKSHGDESEAGSVTDPESDNADAADDDDDDDWFGQNRPTGEQASHDNDAHETTVEISISPFDLLLTLKPLRRALRMLRWGKLKLPWNTTQNTFLSICTPSSRLN
jgi:hypothetical protein